MTEFWLRYDGMVFTDDLGVIAAITDRGDLSEALRQSLASGEVFIAGDLSSARRRRTWYRR